MLVAQQSANAYRNYNGRKISPISSDIPLTSTFSRYHNTISSNLTAAAIIRQKNDPHNQRQRFSDLHKKCSPPSTLASSLNCVASHSTLVHDSNQNESPRMLAKRYTSTGVDSIANRFAELCGNNKKNTKLQKGAVHKYSLDQQRTENYYGLASRYF